MEKIKGFITEEEMLLLKNKKYNDLQIRKLAIKNKYPDLSKAPFSVQKELHIIDDLQGPLDMSADFLIKEFYGKGVTQLASIYEKNMNELAKLREENEEYISSEEIQDFEQKFKFSHLDFEAMEEEKDSIQSSEDCEKLIDKYIKIDSEMLPRDERVKLTSRIRISSTSKRYIKERRNTITSV